MILLFGTRVGGSQLIKRTYDQFKFENLDFYRSMFKTNNDRKMKKERKSEFYEDENDDFVYDNFEGKRSGMRFKKEKKKFDRRESRKRETHKDKKKLKKSERKHLRKYDQQKNKKYTNKRKYKQVTSESNKKNKRRSQTPDKKKQQPKQND